MKKTFNFYIIIWAALLVAFNAVAFLAGGIENAAKYTPSFWIGYGFIMLSFAGQIICAGKAFNAANLQKLFYNLPLISISYTALVFSFILGGLSMLIAALPYWVGAVAAVAALALTAISLAKATIAADTVSDIDDKAKVQTFFIKSLTVDAESLLARAQSDEIKAECKKVYDAVRYSDPMSNDALASAESMITLKFAQLTDAVANNDGDAVKSAAKEVIILIDDRNKKCKLLK